MSETCKKLHDFAYGELGEDAADAFRLHLGTCESCPGELGELLQLIALEEAVSAESAVAPAKESSVAQPEYAEAPVDDLAARRRKRLAFVGVALAAAAAIAFFVLRSGKPGAPQELVIATAETRPLELRVSAADDYRPYEVMRSGEYPVEEISLSILAKLQERGEKQRLANAHLLMREGDKAEALLAELEPTASILADRGVAATLRGDNHAALRYFAESLELEPDNARVLWNQAVVYRDLNLPLGAARLFDRVAKLGEPGWSEEAAKNAAALRGAKEAAESYKKAYQNGSRQIAEGKVLALDIVTRYPGLGRLLFYDAVRSAGSPEALAALEPHATVLDRSYGGDDHARAIARVAKPNWQRRSELAAAYREMLAAGEDANKAAAIVEPALAAKANDIALGALILSRPSSVAGIAQLRSLAEETDDLWFELLADTRESHRLLREDRDREADALLSLTLSKCSERLIAFRCARVAAAAIQARGSLSRVDEAREAAALGIKWANEAQDVFVLSQIRPVLAEVLINADDIEGSAAQVARAYLDEQLFDETHPCTRSYAHSLKSSLYARERRFDDARAALRLSNAERKECTIWPLDPPDAHTKARILAASAVAEEIGTLRDQIATARRTANPSSLVGFDLAEGVALLESSPEEGRALLIRAARGAEAQMDAAAIYGAWALLHLEIDAGKRGAHEEMLQHLASEFSVAVPNRCAVGLAFMDALAVVVVSKSGSIQGRYEPSYELSNSSPLTAEETSRLTGCERVVVIARPPFYGRPALLPDEFAWSFVVGDPPKHLTVELPPKRLVLANVNAPAELGLPALGRWAGDRDNTTLISGREATPERFFREAEHATEIAIHAHGLLATATSEAFLALSATQSGKYRVTAKQISEQRLRGSPTVILGACNAGRSAAYLHEPWGLPIAFRKAGAKQIFASPNPIPDSSSSAFFAALRQKLGSGLSPAVALRDVRVEWRSRSPESSQWAAEILVFE